MSAGDAPCGMTTQAIIHRLIALIRHHIPPIADFTRGTVTAKTQPCKEIGSDYDLTHV